MNTQQILIYHVQFTLPNATTRATATQICDYAPRWLAACNTLANRVFRITSPSTVTIQLRIDAVDARLLSSPPQDSAHESQHRDTGSHILTSLRATKKLHVAVLVPLVEHVHALRVVGLRPGHQRLVAHLALDSVCYCSEHNN